jgi:hypothetical protein
MAAFHGFDDEGCARYTVSGREDTFPGSGQSVGIDGDSLVPREPHPGVIGDKCETGSLSHGENHGVARDCVGCARFFLQLEGSGFIETEGGYSLALHGADASAGIAGQAFKCPSWMKYHPFSLGRFYLPVVGRHLIATLQASQMDFLSETDSAPGAVDGDITTSQNEDPFSEGFSRFVFISAQAYISQKVGIDQNTIEIRTGNGKPDPFMGADRY